MTLPNVARNVVAREIGHAIGLSHNSDPTTLMCGRPAPCRPNTFSSPVEEFFPLTIEEKAALLRMYPAGWKGYREVINGGKKCLAHELGPVTEIV